MTANIRRPTLESPSLTAASCRRALSSVSSCLGVIVQAFTRPTLSAQVFVLMVAGAQKTPEAQRAQPLFQGDNYAY